MTADISVIVEHDESVLTEGERTQLEQARETPDMQEVGSVCSPNASSGEAATQARDILSMQGEEQQQVEEIETELQLAQLDSQETSEQLELKNKEVILKEHVNQGEEGQRGYGPLGRFFKALKQPISLESIAYVHGLNVVKLQEQEAKGTESREGKAAKLDITVL